MTVRRSDGGPEGPGGAVRNIAEVRGAPAPAGRGTNNSRGRFDPALVFVIARYALKACFPTKRRIGLLLPAAGALLFAFLAQLFPDEADVALAEVAGGGLFGVVLPVGCLVIGDAVLGAEVRSGTVHFTWLSPASFPAIVVGRWLAGVGVAAVALGVPFGLAALVAGVPGAVGPLALSAVAGASAYVAVFVMFGALTRRAVVWSLGFVLLGERLLGAALSGLAQWSPGWEAQAVYARFGPDAADTLSRDGIPEGSAAIVRLLLIAAVALVIAALRLGRLRLSGPSGD
jgi:ABC-2 type transport system permease protein